MAVSIVKNYEHKYTDSRYKHATVYNDADGIFFGLPEPRDIETTEDDKYAEITPALKNRMDLISYNIYSVSKLWWVIALANNLDSGMFIDVKDVLTIPAISTLYTPGGVLE